MLRNTANRWETSSHGERSENEVGFAQVELKNAKAMSEYGERHRQRIRAVIMSESALWTEFGSDVMSELFGNMQECCETIKRDKNGQLFPAKTCGQRFLCPHCRTDSFRRPLLRKLMAVKERFSNESHLCTKVTLTLPNNADPLFNLNTENKGNFKAFGKTFGSQKRRDVESNLARGGTLTKAERAFLAIETVLWKYEVTTKSTTHDDANRNNHKPLPYHHHVHLLVIQRKPEDETAFSGCHIIEFIAEKFKRFAMKHHNVANPKMHFEACTLSKLTIGYLFDAEGDIEDLKDDLSAIRLQLSYNLLKKKVEIFGEYGKPLGTGKHSDERSNSSGGTSYKFKDSRSIYKRRTV